MADKTTKQPRARNALVHGLYAQDVLLPWDSKDDFEKLHEDLKSEFMPRGRAEEETVFELAMLHWQKRTLWRMRQTAVLKDPFTCDILETGRKSWSGIRKRLRAAARGDRTLLGAVEAEHTKLFAQMHRLREDLEAASDQQEIKLMEQKIDALMRAINEHVLPLVQKLHQGPNAEKAFDSTYAADSLEKLSRLEAANDARMAKVLARLVGLKEFKRTPAGAAWSLALTNSCS